MPERGPTKRQKQAVARRAGERCEYCFSPVNYSPDSFSAEHVIPRARGGTHSLSNLAYSCQGCNNRKFTRTEAVDPLTGDTVPLYHPRQHFWTDHFAWNEDATIILGRTAVGRATVARLQLNRTGVVNLRRVLVLVGEHPPTATEEAKD